MNCLSLNVRGTGEDVKVTWVRKLKIQHKINFLGLQETQHYDFSRINVKKCWESTDLDFDGVDSNGRSGGLISIWDTKLFQKTKVIKNKSFLIVIGTWSGVPRKTIFADIYGPQAHLI